jgi:hypothetical protein
MQTLVDREARRTGRSRGAIVEALAEEAIRTRLFPGVSFRGVDWDRRAWVIGTALALPPRRPCGGSLMTEANRCPRERSPTAASVIDDLVFAM